DRAAPTTTAPQSGLQCQHRRRAASRRSTAPAAWDRLAPARCAIRPAARQRPRPDVENFGGGVSFRNSLTSYDQLFGNGLGPWRQLAHRHPRRFEVDGELELARLNHRQVRGLRPFEDIARIDADLAKHVRDISSIAHQPANLHKFTL